jgi:hypothetical protein
MVVQELQAHIVYCLLTGKFEAYSTELSYFTQQNAPFIRLNAEYRSK